MIFLTQLIVPFLVIGAFFIASVATKSHTITIKEFATQILISLATIGISCWIIYHSNVSDVEILNGAISHKSRDRVSCSHSYPCNPHEVCSGTGKNMSCMTVWDTCYEHSYDIRWSVKASYGKFHDDFSISRVDSQGLIEPPRWTKINIGEPSSTTNSFDNYIKAASDTLFRKKGLVEKYQKTLPSYPARIFDYYHINRAIGFPDDWNRKIEGVTRVIGPTNQANLIVVNARNKSKEWAAALEQYWLGGKKNDIILVVGTEQNKITWTYVIAWSKHNIFQVKMRDSLNELGTVEDSDKFFSVAQDQIMQYYERKPMKDFEYLTSSFTPTVDQWIWSISINFIISIIAGLFFWIHDPYDPYRHRRKWR